MLALVVGYGMAALFFRAFWPSKGMSPRLGIPAIGLYSWLGLAISGPILLLRHGLKPDRTPDDRASPEGTGSPTWAELAWLLIGIYWIVLGLFVIPSRLQVFRFGDMVLFGLVPVVVSLGLRVFGPKPSPGPGARRRWTHRLGVVLLATWPLAWCCLIILGGRLL
jgi:hypothetical protein